MRSPLESFSRLSRVTIELRASGFISAKSEIFQFLAHVLHADAAGQRRIDIEGFLRDAKTLFWLLNVVQRPHVVQAVGQLHQKNTNVIRHGEHQLAEILRLLGALAKQFQLRKFGNAVDEVCNLVAEVFLYVVDGDVCVFNRIVQERRHNRGHVEFQFRQDGRDFQRNA